ncbi:MAG TPA: helix-turn-helix transcriptional regulator [Acidimicrobiales bacterium]|nr:helix-turn-helix transcriptional regulator [Acidimicrobiales bacterium]
MTTRRRLRHRSGDWVEVRGVITPVPDDRLRLGFAFSAAWADREGSASSAAARAAVLERHMWRIAGEVAASGVAAGFHATPVLEDVPGLEELSPRQWEVLTRLLQGERVPGIAGQLFISQSTVRNHLTDIFRKVGVRSQEELLRLLRPGDGPKEAQ